MKDVVEYVLVKNILMSSLKINKDVHQRNMLDRLDRPDTGF